MTDIMRGAITEGDIVRVRGHWWKVIGRHHSFGALRVVYDSDADGRRMPSTFGPLMDEKTFAESDVEEVR